MTTMTTGSGASAARDNGLTALRFSRGVLLRLLDGIPEEQLCTPAAPGGNHALWIAGHIALVDDSFLNSLAGSEPACPAPWKDLFGRGSEPLYDRSGYPAMAEVHAALDERRQRLLEWFGAMSEEQLRRPLPEAMARFGPSHGALMSTMAIHEGMHAGQLTVMRRALGLPRAIG